MSEDTSATGASETASATEGSGTAGSVNEGTSAGSQGDGTSSAASDSGLEARVRAEQGRADRALAELQKAQARLSELESAGSGNPATDAPAGVTQADLMRMEEMRDVRDALRTQFPLAPQNLTRNYLQYDSPEAMQVAVARAHEAEKADQERRDKEAEARVRAQYEERLGKLPPEAPTNAEGGEGRPTIAQINSWPLSKQMEYESKNPGVIKEITDAAMAGVPILSANQ